LPVNFGLFVVSMCMFLAAMTVPTMVPSAGADPAGR
jgi:hypothetical protein